MTDDKPPGGYLAWHEWADRQVKAGHKQKRCSHCGLYKFPVERVGDICKKCKVTKTDAEFIDEIAEQTDTLLIEEYERLKAIAARLEADEWQPISIAGKYPPEHERVLFFDAREGEWFVGWNAYWHTIGGPSRPGSWVMPSGDTDGMHITHWKPLPKKPQ